MTTGDLFAVTETNPYEDTYCIFCDCNVLRRNISTHSISSQHINSRLSMLTERPKDTNLCKEDEECPYLFDEANNDGVLSYTCGIGFESVIHDDGELGINEDDLPIKPTSCLVSKGVVYEGRA